MPLEVSDRLAEELVQKQLDEAWASTHSFFPNLERPTVPLVRLVSQQEWAQVLVDCMAETGFSGMAVEDGSFQTGIVPADMAEQYNAQLYVCKAQYPLDPKYSAPLSAEQVAYVYAYFRDVLGPCLVEEGYSPAELPSLQSFTEAWSSGGWSPYSTVQPPTEQAWLSLQKDCPPLPADLY